MKISFLQLLLQTARAQKICHKLPSMSAVNFGHIPPSNKTKLIPIQGWFSAESLTRTNSIQQSLFLILAKRYCWQKSSPSVNILRYTKRKRPALTPSEILPRWCHGGIWRAHENKKKASPSYFI